MTRLISVLLFLSTAFAAVSSISIDFHSTPVGDALRQLASKNPEIRLTFIYNELNNYTTSASVNTESPLAAVRQIVGSNPISVSSRNGVILVEALQKGKYTYKGRLIDEFEDPVSSAIVMLLNPKDSVMLTYGVTGENGGFSIPCDERSVVAKIVSNAHHRLVVPFTRPDIGTIRLNTRTHQLASFTVEGDEATLRPDRTVFIPGQRQKNTSMTGVELLERMAIPQLSFNPQTGSPETNSGKSVALFIDYIPASSSDLSAMNMQDVKRVEYLEFPSDPRFNGERYVVNFIMAKYEYGGYVRLYGYENFIRNNGHLQGNTRFQYKSMTYDLLLSGSYDSNTHYGSVTDETYRLPQPDGTEKIFNRLSDTHDAKKENRRFAAIFKATYQSDNITLRNSLAGSLNRMPCNDQAGSVTYIPEDYEDSEFTSAANSRSRYISYDGNFYFSLPNGNRIVFLPSYSFSHTEQNSSYAETGFATVINGATDNTNNLSGQFSYTQNLRKAGELRLFANGNYDYSHTAYTGSANSTDRSRSSRLSVGANYSIEAGKFYGDVAFGYDWDFLKFNDVKTNESSMFASLSLQYAFSRKHKLSGSFSFDTWAPSTSFKSQNVIVANHLMSYTGNPALYPSKRWDIDLNYSWIPSKRFSLSAFASSFILQDRYVYNYEPTATGILRTICQPLGGYSIGLAGVSFSTNFFKRSLRINGGITQRYAYNGAPYDFKRFPVTYYLRVNYYLGDFYFTGNFSSRQDYSDGFMVGDWMQYGCSYSLTAGWANAHWNVRVMANNFGRWNWVDHRSYMNTTYYGNHKTVYSPNEHAWFRLAATYTFSYGKKVKSNNEPSDRANASSSILIN